MFTSSRSRRDHSVLLGASMAARFLLPVVTAGLGRVRWRRFGFACVWARAGGGRGSVRVAVGDRSRAAAVGVAGVVVSLSRADGVADAGRVRVSLGYNGFADAFGGDYAGRLRLVQLPGCALTTPEVSACRVQTP